MNSEKLNVLNFEGLEYLLYHLDLLYAKKSDVPNIIIRSTEPSSPVIGTIWFELEEQDTEWSITKIHYFNGVSWQNVNFLNIEELIDAKVKTYLNKAAL